MFRKLAIVFSWAFALSLSFPAMTSAATYYVSNETSHGYAVGSDSNACTSPGAPCLTIDHAASLGGPTDTVQINPSATAYAENSAAAGYLNFQDVGEITGDPALCGSGVAGSGTYPTIRASSSGAVRVVNLPAKTYSQTLSCLVLDGQSRSGQSGISFSDSTTAKVTISRVKFVNFVKYVVGALSGGTDTLTLDRDLVDNSNAITGSSSLFNWSGVTAPLNVSVLGGDYYLTGNTAAFFFTGSGFGTVRFAADANGALPTCTGTGTPYCIRANGANISALSIAVKLNGIINGILLQTSTVGNGAISGSSFTNLGGVDVRMIGNTCSSFTVSENIHNGAHEFLLGVNEGCNSFHVKKNIVTQTSGVVGNAPINVNGGTDLQVSENAVIINLGARVGKAIQIATNGWYIETSNTGLSTGAKNLGDVSGATYVDQFWTTPLLSSSGRYSHIAAVDAWLSKAGTPSGNVTVALYTDSGGHPGTLVATTAPVAASDLTISPVQYHMTFPTPQAIAASTKYHLVFNYSGAVNGADYVKLDKTASSKIGSLYTSTDASSWLADTNQALRMIIYTASYSTVAPKLFGNRITFLDPSAAPGVAEGIVVGAVNGATISGNWISGAGYAVVIKNTYNAPVAFGNLIVASGTPYGGILCKASDGVLAYNNTIILNSGSTGGAIIADQDTLDATNHIACRNMRSRNNILISSATSYPYWIRTGSTGFVADYDDVYATGSIIESHSGATWSAWRAAGNDLHGTQANPLLPNSATPTKAADLTPAITSPILTIGTDLRSLAPTDFEGRPFTKHPTIGGISVSGQRDH